MPHWVYATNDWIEINQLLDVPPGQDTLMVAPEIAEAADSADFRRISHVAWVTTFDDEFDGTSLDLSRWTPTDTDKVLFSPGAQHFSPDHVIVGIGFARFHADKTPYNGYQWQSGEIRTNDKFQQQYGLGEFRIRIPVTEGTWPAAYLLQWDDAWPPEIDMMECTGAIMQTIFEWSHYADDYDRHFLSNVNLPRGDLDRTAWHTYAVCWEPGCLAWYIDEAYKGTTSAFPARIP